MVEVNIQSLHVQMDNVAGHEHRIQPIVARAAALFTERLHERWANGRQAPDSDSIESLSAPPVSLNLGSMSNEQAASQIATAWLEALALKLQP
jgi:hypothetical protein